MSVYVCNARRHRFRVDLTHIMMITVYAAQGVSMKARIYVYMCIYIYVCIHMYIHMYVYVSIYMYLFIDTFSHSSRAYAVTIIVFLESTQNRFLQEIALFAHTVAVSSCSVKTCRKKTRNVSHAYSQPRLRCIDLSKRHLVLLTEVQMTRLYCDGIAPEDTSCRSHRCVWIANVAHKD